MRANFNIRHLKTIASVLKDVFEHYSPEAGCEVTSFIKIKLINAIILTSFSYLAKSVIMSTATLFN